MNGTNTTEKYPLLQSIHGFILNRNLSQHFLAGTKDMSWWIFLTLILAN